MAVVIAAASLGLGYYIEQQLRPYRAFHLFTAQERGWRDQAFEVGLYASAVAILLLVVARLLRRV